MFLVYRFLSGWADDGRVGVRIAQKIAHRRTVVIRTPESPSAHESLGDALREGNQYGEARQAYERARNLMESHEATGVGHLGGGGLDNKIRLVLLDITEETERNAPYQEQLVRRETICRQCGCLNPPDATHCIQCEKGLLTNTFFEAWRRDDIRHPILREVREGAAVLAVVFLAVYLASWMPIEIKGLLLFSTILVLVVKGLRAITDK